MVERRWGRAAPQRLIRLRALFERALELLGRIAAYQSRDAARENRNRERRLFTICERHRVGTADEIRAVLRHLGESSAHHDPLDGERRHREIAFQRIGYSAAKLYRIPRRLARRIARRHRRRIGAVAEHDPAARLDAVERARWAAAAGSGSAAAGAAAAGVTGLVAAYAGTAMATIAIAQAPASAMRTQPPVRCGGTLSKLIYACSFSFQAARAVADALAALRVAMKRGAMNSQMSQPSPITSMPPMTASIPAA